MKKQVPSDTIEGYKFVTTDRDGNLERIIMKTPLNMNSWVVLSNQNSSTNTITFVNINAQAQKINPKI